MFSQKIIDDHDRLCEATKAELSERGEWNSEPNRVQFVHAGLDCLVIRNPSVLNWCGYVGVPKGNRFYGTDDPECELDVHGGITYASPCHMHICHKPEDGRSDDVWWLGFDCGHFLDLLPTHTVIMKRAMEFRNLNQEERRLWGEYRNQAYVMAETRRLAEQIARLS